MNLRNLQYFAEVVRCSGFARAVDTAHASQPTLSKAVAQLEEEAGLQLLERSRQGVRLTQAGELVFRHAQAMLAQQGLLQQELDALKGVERGELRLGLPSIGSSRLFAPQLAAFKRQHPGISIVLREDGSKPLEEAVLGGDLEVAALLQPFSEHLNCLPVCDEPMLALMPVGHPMAAATSFRLEWLAHSPLILFEQGFALNLMIAAACRDKGITPQETLRSGQIDFIMALVAAGSGIALLPRLTVTDHLLDGLVTRPLADNAIRWQLSLAWRRGVPLSPAAKAFLAQAPQP